MPTLYIIAGCNGAGKTTASYSVLPAMLNCKEFVNADSIAAGISPFQPEKVAFEAGRLMLQRIHQLIDDNVTFAFETTLSTRSYTDTIKKCRAKGYNITLLYFWLSSPDLAIQRVAFRVSLGGHNIPGNIIKRRYKRGLQNLFKLFMPLCDYWEVLDNSDGKAQLIAEGNKNIENFIYNNEIWDLIKSHSGEK